MDGPRTHITCRTCSEKKIPIGTRGVRMRNTRKVRRTGDGRAERRLRNLDMKEEVAADCGLMILSAGGEGARDRILASSGGNTLLDRG
jgi:hypothetical protein